MFSTTRLIASPERGLAIAAGALPAIMVFGAKQMWTENNYPRPRGYPGKTITGLMWLLIVGILAFSGVVAALRFDTPSLVYHSSLALVFALLTVSWMYYQRDMVPIRGRDNGNYIPNSRSTALQLLGLLVLTSRLYATVSTSVTTDTHESDIRIMLGGLTTLPVAWGVYTLILNFIESNR